MFMRMSVAVSLLLGGVFAQADQYKYGAVSVTCESYVTSQTIDSAVQQIGSVPIEQITYSYLRIEQSHNEGQHLITAKCDGICQHGNFLRSGGIPNPIASENIPVQNASQVASHTISFLGGRGLSVALNLNLPFSPNILRNGNSSIYHLAEAKFTQGAVDPAKLHAMITAAGGANVPDFAIDPPAIRPSVRANQVVMLQPQLRFRSIPGELQNAYIMNGYSLRDVQFAYQISYPPARLNGLS